MASTDLVPGVLEEVADEDLLLLPRTRVPHTGQAALAALLNTPAISSYQRFSELQTLLLTKAVRDVYEEQTSFVSYNHKLHRMLVRKWLDTGTVRIDLDLTLNPGMKVRWIRIR
jgi:hypothetical protein